jgi:hypothetical protein
MMRLRKRKPRQQQTPAPSAGPRYEVVEGGAAGCRFCESLRELLRMQAEPFSAQFSRVFDEGGCFVTVPGVPWILVTRGNDGYSLFDLAQPVNPPPAGYSTALWFRDADMAPAGGDEHPQTP